MEIRGEMKGRIMHSYVPDIRFKTPAAHIQLEKQTSYSVYTSGDTVTDDIQVLSFELHG